MRKSRFSPLAKRIKDLTNSPSEIVMIPYEQPYEAGFEDMRRVPDITKIRDFVGYEPRVPLGQILTKVIDYFRASSAPRVSDRHDESVMRSPQDGYPIARELRAIRGERAGG